MAKTREAGLKLELRAAILGTGLLQPVQLEQSGTRISALCRQVPGQEKAWLRVAQDLLRAAGDIRMHLCRKYTLKDNVIAYGWHLGFEARTVKELREAVAWLAQQLENVTPDLSAPPARQERLVPSAASPVADPAFRDDMEVRRAKLASHTTAEPRHAVYDPDLSLPEPAETPTLRTVHRSTATDSRNRVVPVVIQEMPLPHVNVADMNKPNEKGRGAVGAK